MKIIEERFSSGKLNPGTKGSGSKRFIKRGRKNSQSLNEKNFTTVFVVVGTVVFILIILILYGNRN